MSLRVRARLYVRDCASIVHRGARRGDRPKEGRGIDSIAVKKRWLCARAVGVGSDPDGADSIW